MDIEFLVNKAIKLHVRGKVDKAEEIYKKIINIDPNNIISLNNLGSILNTKENFEKSLSFVNRALEIKPDYADALNNKGNCLKGLNKFDEAIEYYKKGLIIKPNFVGALNNLATSYNSIGRHEEAIPIFKKVIELKPNYYEALYNQGICLYNLNLFDEAKDSYEKAIKVKPDFIEAYYNLSLLQMLQGNYKEGLKNYEWRKKRNKTKKYPQFDNDIEWLGDKDLKNKIIYISKEQGLGDYIQHCRYLLLVKNLGAKIILDTPKVLRPMIDNMEIDYKHLDDLKKLEFDYHCSIISLPLAFNTTLNTVPEQIPYLFTPKNNIDFWKKKLNKKDKLRIGLNWTGNSSYVDDENRSTTLKELKPILDLPFEFHSLEINYSQKDEDLLNKTINLECHKEDILGFDNTAGLIENMDLIITTDTSIAHLCGALGRPVWILLSYIPDYRWLLNSKDTPWYPTAKLYRQSQKKNWQGLFHNVVKDLKKFNTNFK
jgi:tetratricopeptide (TPR) repeat protein